MEPARGPADDGAASATHGTPGNGDRTHRVTVACVSDTHGRHRDLEVPRADILIHAGDFTAYGKLTDAIDFNAWLGELPHPHKIVINGNHESNADWQKRAAEILSNATHLVQQGASYEVGPAVVNVFGTQFFWPIADTDVTVQSAGLHGCGNPAFDQVPAGVDIVVTHGPVKGRVDGGGSGCSAAARMVHRVRPKLVVSGHIHHAHGVVTDSVGTTFVNAANCRKGRTIGWDAVVVDLDIPIPTVA